MRQQHLYQTKANHVFDSPSDYTILIVDDTLTNLKVINNYLTQVGFRTLIASSGEAALTRARHGKPHLILLDVLMPGIDGFETCRMLKSTPITSNIPVIFMTALTDIEDKVRGFESGAVDYITKPIQYEELLARISTHLQIYELTEGLEAQVTIRTNELTSALEREQQLSFQLQEALEREQGLTQQLRTALDQEIELVRMKSQVLNVISHEFRTPLSVIATSTHMLTENSNRLPPERKQMTQDRIDNAISYLTELLDSSFLVNEMQETSLKAYPEPVDFPAACRSYVADIRMLSTNKIHEQYIGFDNAIEVDMGLTRRIVTNFLNNAQKFSPDQTPIYFSAELHQNCLMIHVRDEGVGIPQADQPHIFKAFQRAQNAQLIHGLGLGLSIVHNAVEAMGGKLSAESAGEGMGSCFSAEIPVKIASQEKFASQLE